jgi:hypothetical protein
MTHAWGRSPGEDDDPRVAGSNTGRLTAVDQDFDPYTGIPRMSAIPVRVRRAPAADQASRMTQADSPGAP